MVRLAVVSTGQLALLAGRYVGSRPIKLSKSNWKDRNVDVVKEKQSLKKKMGYKY
jgi:hypothetical protein